MKSDGKIKKLGKPKSIKVSVWKYYCLLVLVLVLVAEIAACCIVVGTLEVQARNRLIDKGNAIASALKDGTPDVDELFSGYLDDGVYCYLYDSGGELIATSSDGPSVDFGTVKGGLSGASVGKVNVFARGDSLFYSVKVNYGGDFAYLVVSSSLGVIHSTIIVLVIYFVVVGFCVAALAVVISYTLSQRLTRGLNSISEKAVKLAEGDYSVDFHNADYAELGQLSDSLNYVRDEVKKSGDFQREIIANVTHDLKTPLTMIKAYASMIKEISGDNPKKRDEHLQVIIDEADRLTGLVNDILNVSKISSNIESSDEKVFNLTDFLYGIIEKFGYLQQSQGYTIMVDVDSNIYIRAEQEKIGQVIYNLVSNAVNYTGADKTVYISLKNSLDGAEAKFSVRDTGRGLTEEEIPHIWDRYYRSEDSHVRSVKGTGLGLSIVKKILDAHGFLFGVESRDGEGATFWVNFPTVPPEPAADGLTENGSASD